MHLVELKLFFSIIVLKELMWLGQVCFWHFHAVFKAHHGLLEASPPKSWACSRRGEYSDRVSTWMHDWGNPWFLAPMAIISEALLAKSQRDVKMMYNLSFQATSQNQTNAFQNLSFQVVWPPRSLFQNRSDDFGRGKIACSVTVRGGAFSIWPRKSFQEVVPPSLCLWQISVAHSNAGGWR